MVFLHSHVPQAVAIGYSFQRWSALMAWTQHRCICPLKHRVEPCGSLTLVGVRSQGANFHEDHNWSLVRYPMQHEGIAGELEYERKAFDCDEPLNLGAIRFLRGTPLEKQAYFMRGDVLFLTDPRPRPQWRRDGEIDPEEFEEWVEMNIQSTVCGFTYSRYHKQTAITFAEMPTKTEQVWLRVRWA